MVIPISSKLQASFGAITSINEVLRIDTEECLKQLASEVLRFKANGSVTDDTRYILRKTIRTFMTHVDGIAFAFRDAVLTNADDVGLVLTKRERAGLRERKYDASADKITDERDPLSTPEGLKLALRYFPKLFGSTYVLDTSGVAWRMFLRLSKVRNRITHPRSLEQFAPVNAGPVLIQCLFWFFRQTELCYLDIAPRIGVQLRSVTITPDPFIGFNEKEHPLMSIYTKEHERIIAADPSKSLEYVSRLLDHSESDRSRALDEVKLKSKPLLSPTHQGAIRNAVRTIFANTEAITYAAQRFLEAAESRGDIQLTEGDHALFVVGELEDKFAGALTLWSREFGDGRVWLTSGEAWKNFRGARFLRNRLTHPKSVRTLRVGLPELNLLLAALTYYGQALSFMTLNRERWADICRLKHEREAGSKDLKPDESTKGT
jgi:hypothetical protein